MARGVVLARERLLLHRGSGVDAQRQPVDVMLASAPEPRKPLVRDVLLRDRSSFRLQTPTPADYEDIKAFYDGLSRESRYFRFHGFARTDLAARADA